MEDASGGKVIGIELDVQALQADIGKTELDALGQLLVVMYERWRFDQVIATEPELDPQDDRAYFWSLRLKTAVTDCKKCLFKQRSEPRKDEPKPESRPIR